MCPSGFSWDVVVGLGEENRTNFGSRWCQRHVGTGNRAVTKIIEKTELLRHVKIAQNLRKNVDLKTRKDRSSGSGGLRNFDVGGEHRQPRCIQGQWLTLMGLQTGYRARGLGLP